ncbi:MAG: hypothetical protein BKP49_00945 [Treponema sp. CETP13]|nr:MAG: hypothetical protein BKP49_00945 [Treponema sp. CETP13]
MKCPFCRKNDLYSIYNTKNMYWRCKNCNGIIRDKSFLLSPPEQKKRYLYHNNDINDPGYKKFLMDFIQPILDEASQNCSIIQKPITRIIDYGCGPIKIETLSNLNCIFQALVEKSNSDNQTLFASDCELLQWDPFFSPNPIALKDPADLVCCLEVVEHFENSKDDFEYLAKACKVGGIVVIGTMLVPDKDEDFKKWWYKNDATHVSFYSLESLKQCGINVGLQYVKALTERCFMFVKI